MNKRAFLIMNILIGALFLVLAACDSKERIIEYRTAPVSQESESLNQQRQTESNQEASSSVRESTPEKSDSDSTAEDSETSATSNYVTRVVAPKVTLPNAPIIDEPSSTEQPETLLEKIAAYDSPFKRVLMRYMEGEERENIVLAELLSINREIIGKLLEFRLLIHWMAESQQLTPTKLTKVQSLVSKAKSQLKSLWVESQGSYDFSHGYFAFGFGPTGHRTLSARSQQHFVFKAFNDHLLKNEIQFELSRPERKKQINNPHQMVSREIAPVLESSQDPAFLFVNGFEYAPYNEYQTLAQRHLQNLLHPLVSFMSFADQKMGWTWMKKKRFDQRAQSLQPVFWNSDLELLIDDGQKQVLARFTRDNNRQDHYFLAPFRENLNDGLSEQIYEKFQSIEDQEAVHGFNLNGESLIFWLPTDILKQLISPHLTEVKGAQDYSLVLFQLNTELLEDFDQFNSPNWVSIGR